MTSEESRDPLCAVLSPNEDAFAFWDLAFCQFCGEAAGENREFRVRSLSLAQAARRNNGYIAAVMLKIVDERGEAAAFGHTFRLLRAACTAGVVAFARLNDVTLLFDGDLELAIAAVSGGLVGGVADAVLVAQILFYLGIDLVDGFLL